ncbi:MAG: hypothetical protein JO015_19325 [Verrucomicrobia bacterium]|nr:hypothetical protein [Verrucomicrobiota bacterium]
MKLSSSVLRKAAEVQEQIEQLESELHGLLETGNSTDSGSPAGSAAQDRGSKEGEQSGARSRRAGRPAPVAAAGTASANGRSRGRRSTSPSGPLAPAVVKVLRAKSNPMSVAEILDGLNASGYKFTSPEPKKNLFARIYRLKGVRQVGPGRFTAE